MSGLPAGTTYGNGLTAGEMRELAMKRCHEISRGRSEVKKEEAALLLAATDAVVIEYRDHFLELGEARAMTWLKQQAKPEK